MLGAPLGAALAALRDAPPPRAVLRPPHGLADAQSVAHSSAPQTPQGRRLAEGAAHNLTVPHPRPQTPQAATHDSVIEPSTPSPPPTLAPTLAPPALRIDISGGYISGGSTPPRRRHQLLVTGGSGFVLSNVVARWLEGEAADGAAQRRSAVIFDLPRAWDAAARTFFCAHTVTGRLQA